VAYDAHALISKDGGLGKGIQLNNILGPYRSIFLGLAPAGPKVSSNITRAGFKKYIPWQQFSLPKLLSKLDVEVFLAPYNTAPVYLPRKIKLILVLHDLILMENLTPPASLNGILAYYRRSLIGPAVRRAKVVLTVSEFSKSEILRRFPGTRVHVLPCTIADSWFVRGDYVPTEKRGNYLLLVTGAAAHKNFPRALAAFAEFAHKTSGEKTFLRIVGLSAMKDSWREMLNSLGIEELVAFEPFLPEMDLQRLYRYARAVVVPSLMEGFGIPVLEAMASGTPVICSNTTSIPEVGGKAAKYFDPTDIKAICQVVTDVMSDDNLRTRMLGEGIQQAEKFHPAVLLPRIQTFWDLLAEGDSLAV
jgi:glycosyltransferase involved in cell wall biosynthesis